MATASVNPQSLTPAVFTAFITVHTILPMMQELGMAQSPLLGVPLEDHERAKMNLPPGGGTIVYKVGKGQVLMDISGPNVLLLYAGEDAANGLAMLEGALVEKYPSFGKLDDIAHPQGGRRRVRGYQGDLLPGRIGKIEAEYPERGATGDDNRFIVRISCYDGQTDFGWRAGFNY